MSANVHLLPRLVLIISLGLISLYFFNTVELYHDVGTELLTAPVLAEDQLTATRYTPDTLNTISPSKLEIVVENKDASTSNGIRYLFPAPSGKMIRARASVALTPSATTVNANVLSARVFIASKEASGEWLWNIPHLIVQLKGIHNMQEYTFITQVPENAVEMLVSGEIIHSVGKLVVQSLSVKVIEPTIRIKQSIYVLLGIWAIVGCWVIFPLIISMRGRIIVLSGIFLLYLMMMPYEHKIALINLLRVFLQNNKLLSGHIPNNTVLASIGHFFIYFGFSALVLRLSNLQWLKVVGLLVSLAMLSEVLQFFTADRTPQIKDFLVNSSGVLCAALVTQTIRCIRRYFARCQQKSDLSHHKRMKVSILANFKTHSFNKAVTG